jgi:hypothetical protein
MHWTAATTLADRLRWFVDELCKTIGADAHARGMEAALAWAIWNRVRLLGERLVRLAERMRAGKHQVIHAPRAEPGPRAPKSSETQCSATASLPGDFGWVARLLPHTAQFAGILHYMLRDPELAALVEQAPQAARIVRPLCHLLGVKEADFLRPRRDGEAAPSPALLRLAAERPAGDPGAAAAAGVGAAVPPSPDPPEPPGAPPPPAVVPPVPVPDPAAERARIEAYYKRPGGLYWDGRRLQWS